MDRVSAASLRGHVSFLASDLLEGRNTPSRGLDIAAEYIAAQYRGDALARGGDDGYFQTSEWTVLEQDLAGFECTFRVGDRVLRLSKDRMVVGSPDELDLVAAPVFKLKLEEAGALKVEDTDGKVLVAMVPGPILEPPNQKVREGLVALTSNWGSLKPALLVLVDPSGSTVSLVGSSYLVRPGRGPQSGLRRAVIVDKEAAKFFDAIPFGATEAKVSLRLNPRLERRVKLRNVVGMLQGSDPVLKDTCVVLSAHYDHIEPAAVGDGDRIFNGANDDASGVAGLLELASALNGLPRKPKRSIVFAAFFGEEKGRLGSAAYLANPPCPLDKTVANVNLEQIGRTDSAEGPVLDRLYLPGFDYSDVGRIFAEAALRTGVTAARHEQYSDTYFGRSDNITFALRGIPAHSVSVLFQYPDYHLPGDHWDKIDYDNMAKVTRTIGMAVLMLADSPAAPQWDTRNAKTAPYVEAQRKLQAK